MKVPLLVLLTSVTLFAQEPKPEPSTLPTEAEFQAAMNRLNERARDKRDAAERAKQEAEAAKNAELARAPVTSGKLSFPEGQLLVSLKTPTIYKMSIRKEERGRDVVKGHVLVTSNISIEFKGNNGATVPPVEDFWTVNGKPDKPSFVGDGEVIGMEEDEGEKFLVPKRDGRGRVTVVLGGKTVTIEANVIDLNFGIDSTTDRVIKSLGVPSDRLGDLDGQTTQIWSWERWPMLTVVVRHGEVQHIVLIDRKSE